MQQLDRRESTAVVGGNPGTLRAQLQGKEDTMSLLQRICKGPLMWWLILLALASTCPPRASEGAEDQSPTQ